MKKLHLSLSSEKKPLYLKIADALRQSIRNGQTLPGERLPSTREWASMFQVHRHTVMNAFNELVAEGWLVAEERYGYKVCQELPRVSISPQTNTLSSLSDIPTHTWEAVRLPSFEDVSTVGSYHYSFQGGKADFRLFPFQELKSHMSDALKAPSPDLLAYGDPQGHLPLIDALEVYLRRMRALTGKTVLITHGSQEAIYLSGQVLLNPGDKVAVEQLGYPPAWSALEMAGAHLVTIAQDAQGIDPDDFKHLARQHKIKMLYLTPLHQYPTTRTLPISRRMAIYEIAAHHGIPILEDDYDHEFHYRCQPLAPLASDDPAKLVIYISTFSKVLFPSARLGFMAVSPDLAKLLLKYRKIINHHNETLMQDGVARWMASGGLERHLRRMCNTYEKRRDGMVECLNEARGVGIPLEFRAPDGGMALWLNTFKDSKKIAEKAHQANVFVHAEQDFNLHKKEGTHLRLGFASQTPEETQRGLQILLKIIQTI